MKSVLAGIAIASVLAVAGHPSGTAIAQESTQKPLTIVVPWAPGGPADLLARGLVEQGAALLKQPIVIMNRPGGSGTIGTAEVFRANPDGNTLLLADNISSIFQPHRLSLPYRGYEDFQPVIKLTDVPNVLVVGATSKWQSLADLITDARTGGNPVRIATAGRFTGTDLNVLEFNNISGVQLQTIPSSGGTAQALTLILGNHVEGAVAAPASIVSHVNSGSLRPLAIYAQRRISLFPELPTTSELGYKTTMSSMFYLAAPKGVDPAVVERLNAAFRQVILSEAWKTMSTKFGLLTDPGSPQALTQELDQWRRYFSDLAKALKVQPER